MNPILRNFLRMNWPLFGLMVALLAYGIYAIHSATWMRDQEFAKSQLTWILVCTPMFFLITLLDYRWVRFGAVPLYILGILGLMLTMFIGEKRYGARSWLDLGPMSFQPSQLAHGRCRRFYESSAAERSSARLG
jgi:cell division protein FtsW (lipid II flippase)